MSNQNRKPDQDPLPKNMVPNQEPKPIPQKEKRVNQGQWYENDTLKRSELNPDSENNQENKGNNKE
ncbi:hypothetical protein [Flavobacterium beibuense]|uniref:Uncharacterized protein n=1 Tax=Flavobacterium beibuense F44-8 TaxID=1406840 RepID=A0A0A2LTD9_9FLAO|nr:hypothetical protein [Flavobacterium beibuense]KGO83597.1 hypothetical protein Q763_03265 [Flavobacterium beibuense F44-8]